jgi:3'-5' exoribonuclease
MQHIKISSLEPGQVVESVYLIQGLDQRLKKNSEPYFFITLQDNSGTITAMLWEKYDDFIEGKIKVNDFIKVKGSVRSFNNQLQLTIKEYVQIPEDEVDIQNFQQVSARDITIMKKELNEYIEKIEDKKLQKLVKMIFADKKIYNDFCDAPSSVSMHQAYIHGLIEHTLGVVKNSLTIAEHYPKINKDMLIVGGILHDIGKIYEYSWTRTLQITDVGRLLGHISIAYDLVVKAIDKIEDFNDEYRTQIQIGRAHV